MTITLTQRPHKFCFSKNPIQYQFTVPGYADAGAIIHVELYMRQVGAITDPVLIYTETIKPSLDTEVNLQDIIDANVDYLLPDFSGAVIQSGFTHIKEFFIRYAVTSDADTMLVWNTEETKLRYAIKGGIANPQWDWNNYFIYLRTAKLFLTWQPNNCFVGPGDVFFVSYLNTVATVPLTLKVNVEYSDGSMATININFGDSGELRLYHIAAGVGQLGIDITLQVYRYTLQVVETATPTNIFAGPFTYYIDYRQFYYTKFLHYYNSLGGLQYTRVRGDIEYEVPRNFAESERYHGITVIGSPTKDEYTQSGITKIDTYKGETGYIHTLAEMDVLQELMLTAFAWERRFYPASGLAANLRIYITQRSAKMGITADKKQSLALEWRYSFTNQVYTPMVDLGAGLDEEDYTPICTPVAISGSPALPDIGAAEVYSYSFTVTGTAPFTLSDITKPAWMTIAVLDNTINFSGTPAAEDAAAGVEVSFTINNACGSVDFADTIDVTATLPPFNWGFVFIANPDVSPGDYWTTIPCAGLGAGYSASGTVYLIPSAVDPVTGEIISGSQLYTDAACTVPFTDSAQPNFIGFRIIYNSTTGLYKVVDYQTEIGLASVFPEICP